MLFEPKSLPYRGDALEPHISERTMSFHHGKHYAGYVAKLNEGIRDTDHEEQDLEAIIRRAAGDANHSLFNAAAQSWNHEFFWNSLTPDPVDPPADLKEALADAFGSMDGFREEFKATATGQFGSGWAWLVLGNDRLEVTSTSNADLPMVHGQVALLCCDVWEHAYYLDYQNRRGAFVDAFLEHLINWRFAARNWEEHAKEERFRARVAPFRPASRRHPP